MKKTQRSELQVVRVKTPVGNNSIKRCFHIMYMTRFEWEGKQYDFWLTWVERDDFNCFDMREPMLVYCRSCGGFIVGCNGKLEEMVYEAYTDCLSKDMLRRCVKEFMEKGPMAGHCIGSPRAAKTVSRGFSCLSLYIGKENGIFDQRSLEKRRAMLTEEVASLRRVGSFMEPTDKETEVLRLAVDINDFRIIQKYRMMKGKRIYEDALPL